MVERAFWETKGQTHTCPCHTLYINYQITCNIQVHHYTEISKLPVFTSF